MMRQIKYGSDNHETTSAPDSPFLYEINHNPPKARNPFRIRISNPNLYPHIHSCEFKLMI